MTPEQFQRVEELFFEASALPSAERRALLDTRCADDPVVRREVEAMLGAEGKAAQVESMHDRLMSTSGIDNDPTDLDLSGERVGPYTLDRMIARGGMGVVYAATDTRLGRTVAIKVLPRAFATDVARRARLVREAKILASLSHPNIATIFGLEEVNQVEYLVMEYVDGQTLAARLERGSLSLDEALTICCSIAAALEAAHDAGVVHRDLKPGNVMLTRDGRVKVLDFGLARGAVAQTETRTNATREGVVIGTPGYMSPEQARGLNTDRRTDVFAFGCVMYECLCGCVAFNGTSHADILAAVLEREPDWERLPAKTPGVVQRLLRRCLVKDVSQRLRDMGDVRLELEEVLRVRPWGAPSGEARGSGLWTEPAQASRSSHRRMPLVAASFALVAVLATALAAAAWLRPAPSMIRHSVKRFTIPYPQEQFDLSRMHVALSRDGRRMVFVAADQPDGGTSLWMHDFTRNQSQALPGTQDGWVPFLSPDGEWVGFYDDGALRKRRINGGENIAVTDTFSWFGASWGSDGNIVYTPYWNRPIALISDQGSDTDRVISSFREDRGDMAHMLPCLLRDNSGVLYAAWRGKEEVGIDCVDFKTGRTHTVVQQGCTPKLAQTPYGLFLLWERRGSLFAARFDEKTRSIVGPEAAIADGVLVDLSFFSAAYDVSDDGMLAYVAGPRYVEESRLAWLNPEPTLENEPFNSDVLPFGMPQFSRDMKKLSVVLKGTLYRGYLYDLELGTFTRASSEHDATSAAVSPDGKSYAFASNRDGRYGIWLRDLGTGAERMLVPGERDQPMSFCWTSDSKELLFAMSPDDQSARELWVVKNDATPTLRQLTKTEFEDISPSLTPDNRFIAYSSNETGRREIYVATYPDFSGRRQVSIDGGSWPVWAPDGKSLYFRNGDRLMQLPFDPAAGAFTGTPTVVSNKRFGQSDVDLPDYTVAPTGRILIIEPPPKRSSVNSITVVIDWYEMLPAEMRGATR